MPKIEPKYVVTRAVECNHGYRDYLFEHPETKGILATEAFEKEFQNANCYAPHHLHRKAAERWVQTLNESLAAEAVDLWCIRVAPNPCASCGREMWANDLDFLYPNNRERTEWRAGCNVHDFGCGFEVIGKSSDDVQERWNNAQLFEYPHQNYSKAEGKGLDVLGSELNALFEAYPGSKVSTGYASAFNEMVRKFAADPFYKLHFVAQQYLRLQEHREA